MKTKGIVWTLVVTLCTLPLLAAAQASNSGPPAPLAPTDTTPRPGPAHDNPADEHDDDLCPRSTGSRVLQPKSRKGSHAGCVNHGWSYGPGEVPGDGDMGSALQQLSPAIH